MIMFEADRMAKLMVVVMKYPRIFLLFMDVVRVPEYTVSTNDELERIWKWTWPIPDTFHKLPGVTKEKNKNHQANQPIF